MKKPGYFRHVLILFIVATMVPASIISIAYTLIAGTALKNETESRLVSETNAFASQIANIANSCQRNLEELSKNKDVLNIIDSKSSYNPVIGAKGLRSVIAAFPRKSQIAEGSVISIDGKNTLRIGDEPKDRNMEAFNSWGIFRKLKEAPVAVIHRSLSLSDGSDGCFTIGVAIKNAEDDLCGYALADIKRAAIVNAAIENGVFSGAKIINSSGVVIFYQNNQALEGSFSSLDLKNKQNNYIVSPINIAGEIFYIMVEAVHNQLDDFIKTSRMIAISTLFSALLLAIILSIMVSSHITKPVLDMASKMKKVEAGDLSVKIETNRDDELGDLARSFNNMTTEIQTLMNSAVEKQELLREAELKSLAAQMNPHFLHNTLASIKSLAQLNKNPEITTVVTSLGKLLRAGINKKVGKTTCGESLSLVNDYLQIEKIRFGSRFEFTLDIDDSIKNVEILPLCLEPIAENSLTHGLEKKLGKGHLLIKAYTEGEDAIISFIDDGPGIEDEKLLKLQEALSSSQAPKSGDGMGLLGTNRRLFLEYGQSYGLSLEKNSDQGVKITVKIPKRVR